MPTNSVSNSYLYVICAQNPNPGSIQWYNGNTVTQLGTDTSGCAGIAEWFNFYEDAFIRGCKVRAEIANNQASNAIVIDAGPTVHSTLAYGTAGTVPYDSSGIQPQELPMFRRTIIGGSNSTQTGTVKFYIPVRKMLGVKDMEDIYDVGVPTAQSTDPKVPNFESATDGNGQSLTSASVFGNLVLTSMQSYTDTPGDPVGPPHSVRIIVTYYVQFRNRRLLAG